MMHSDAGYDKLLLVEFGLELESIFQIEGLKTFNVTFLTMCRLLRLDQVTGSTRFHMNCVCKAFEYCKVWRYMYSRHKE